MRTEYQISGSTSVTSRENGALHEMVIDEALLIVSRSPTDDSGPVSFAQKHYVGRQFVRTDKVTTIIVLLLRSY